MNEELSKAVTEVSNGVRIACHVQPRASRAKFCGLYNGSLKIALTAPPVDGKANAALCEFLAGLCGMPKSSASIASGQTSRTKTVLISGITRQAVLAALGKNE